MADLAALKAKNEQRWAAAKLTRASEFTPVAARLAAPAAKARYKRIESKTGVPWYFVAVTHQRESSQDWSRSLAQGDPWNKVSTHVPKGRGPFASFEDAAVDALVNCHPYAARNKDWSVGGLLTLLEQYNGLGYFNGPVSKVNGQTVRFPSQASPYIWSGTNQYVRGKYIADGVFDSNAVDKQLGCAGLLLAMQQVDPSIKLGSVPTTTPTAPPKAANDNAPSSTPSGWGAVFSTLAKLFQRKAA